MRHQNRQMLKQVKQGRFLTLVRNSNTCQQLYLACNKNVPSLSLDFFKWLRVRVTSAGFSAP